MIMLRLIVWVVIFLEEKGYNLVLYSFFMGVFVNLLSLIFFFVNCCDGLKKDMLFNIEENGEFVVNVVSYV